MPIIPKRFYSNRPGQGCSAIPGGTEPWIPQCPASGLFPSSNQFGDYITANLAETIFSWPGVGRYVLNAIEKRDLPAVQGSILFLSLIFVLVNLITDLLYAKERTRVAYD